MLNILAAMSGDVTNAGKAIGLADAQSWDVPRLFRAPCALAQRRNERARTRERLGVRDAREVVALLRRVHAVSLTRGILE